MAYITKTWFGRYKVWTIGHTLGDEWCIATFRFKCHAEHFIESMGYTPAAPEAKE